MGRTRPLKPDLRELRQSLDSTKDNEEVGNLRSLKEEMG